MKHFSLFSIALALIFLFSAQLFSQNVGIGTSTPLAKLHVAGNARINTLAGVGTRVVGSDANGTLINIAAGSNGQVLTQTAAGPVFQVGGANISSVSLATDYTVTSAAWANVAPMSLTFTATKSSVLLLFSASGFAYTNSMAYVQFRIRNGTTSLGGTNSLTQNYDDVNGTITPWSCTYSRLVTGLTPGNTYTFQLQAQRSGILGTYDTAIYAASNSDTHHMTLSVIQ